MAKITIKTAHDQKGNQYWFAENENKEVFHLTYGEGCFKSEIEAMLDNTDYKDFKNCFTKKVVKDWSFNDLDKLKNALKNHFQKEPKIVETLTF